MKIKTIDINFKEWYDKTYSNSYCAGTITLNFGMKTEKKYTVPFIYRHGGYYEQRACAELKAKGYFKKLEKNLSICSICRREKIILRSNLQRNCLKRELTAFGGK